MRTAVIAEDGDDNMSQHPPPRQHASADQDASKSLESCGGQDLGEQVGEVVLARDEDKLDDGVDYLLS